MLKANLQKVRHRTPLSRPSRNQQDKIAAADVWTPPISARGGRDVRLFRVELEIANSAAMEPYRAAVGATITQ
jgi:hypothetical protein